MVLIDCMSLLIFLSACSIAIKKGVLMTPNMIVHLPKFSFNLLYACWNDVWIPIV